MTIPQLTTGDLSLLKGVFPDLNFGDAERQAVLLAAGSCDINAAPGSGKTTILAAKLYLLARKWPHARRGICVISHTNVAREEIQRRLMATPEGSRMLAYPHFIGTIHAFINHYLALPWMRSNGYAVDVIDNDAFALHALRLARRIWTLKAWMEKDESVADMIATLQYEGPDLLLTAGKGRLPGPNSKSLPHLHVVKKTLTERGVFRFEDMFAFADRLLRTAPWLRQRLSHRFPLLLIDEMQDTSWAQEELLGRLFDASVVTQRYGDINQQILSTNVGAESLTFPRAGFLNISTSKRFSTGIANAVSAVQLVGAPVVGERVPTKHRPTLLLYVTEVVETVIPQFGRLVLDAFSDEELRSGGVKALCTRKQGNSKEAPGRHLGDYWPPFAHEVAFGSTGADSAWSLLVDGKASAGVPFNLNARSANVRRFILLSLRAAKSMHVEGIRDANQLFRSLQRSGVGVQALRRTCRDLVVARGLTESDAQWTVVHQMLYAAALPLLPDGMTPETFASLNVFAKPDGEVPLADAEARECVVERDGRKVCVGVGTVASMKGETHLASLILESHGGQSKRFDLGCALPILCGAEQMNPKASSLLKGQYRNLYVAMSRPSHYMCVAMNVARAKPEHISLLEMRGWSIERLV